MMNQYYIDAPDGSPGDNRHLFVTASTPDEAVSLWTAYYEMEAEEVKYLSESARLCLVPAIATVAGAHRWNDSVRQWNISTDGSVTTVSPRD